MARRSRKAEKRFKRVRLDEQAARRQGRSFVLFMQASPWAEVELDLTRSGDTGRGVAF